MGSCQENFVQIKIKTPKEFLGVIIDICKKKRASSLCIEYAYDKNINITCIMPFSEIIINFFDNIKYLSKGYATLIYNIIGYREAKIVKIDILINKEKIDILSFIAHPD